MRINNKSLTNSLSVYVPVSYTHLDVYKRQGKKTFGSWYNMGAQDVVPTYRWLVYNAGTTTVSTDIQPEFTHEDSCDTGLPARRRGRAYGTMPSGESIPRVPRRCV